MILNIIFILFVLYGMVRSMFNGYGKAVGVMNLMIGISGLVVFNTNFIM